ncbi:phosphoserine phosphatase SerB [Moraxella caviae]|uniref:Phosphoserine phosphatase n=2 Tax=Moraxella caviae TaxID=34060 RepID=A0A1T0AAX4_9GAMM|nr:phosphoserine phosphatase SerB [Moraxella caviae]OOR92808.1 phosphoserine phosphatase SerB [Moraxella caviae]STZ14155.1 Phosphoserine phosphatase [Moraxella caviae]VEW12601.1 Phosphoserine phosphatase [Moraxella caviae]
MTIYALPNQSQAWRTAFHQALPVLPDGVGESDAKVLATLPIFAIVVVSKAEANHAKIDALMNDWVQAQANWQLIFVADDEAAKAAAHHITPKVLLSDVSIHRYLLAPKVRTEMSSAKREAAAHIIDEQLSAHLREFDTDVHILSLPQMLNTHKLACFDMDSTLIEQEVIVELAKFCGIEDKVSEITEEAMRGEIDFNTSFARRVALLEGVSADVVDEIIAKHISFQPGAHALMQSLKALGYYTILVSGGFVPFAKYVAETLGMDEYHANPLLIDDGRLTGQIDDDIVDGAKKAQIAKKVADKLGIGMEQVVCVGDGANDLPMMAAADVGIAYHAKPIVQAKADAAINVTGLEGVLYALGHRFDKI